MRSSSRGPRLDGVRRWFGADNMHVTRQYLSLGLAELFGAGCGFLAVLLVARNFGPAGLGMVSLAINLVGYASIFVTFGTLEYSVIRVAGREDLLASQASSVGFVRLILSLVFYLALVALVHVSPAFESIRGLTAILGLTLFSTAIKLTWVAQALQRTTALAVSKLGFQVVNLTILWFMLLRWSRLESVMWSRTATELLVAFGFLVWYRRVFGAFGPLLPARGLLHLLRSSAPVAGTKLVRALSAGSDLVVVGLLVSASDLGVYSAAIRIFLLMTTLVGSYYIILLPRLGQRAVSGRAALRRELARSLGLVMPIASIALGAVAWVAEPLLLFLFDEEYAVAAPALRLLCLALWINVISMHLRHSLLALGRQRLDLAWTSIGAALHVVFKIQATLLLGITGAALATVLGEVFIGVGLCWSLVRALSHSSAGDDE